MGDFNNEKPTTLYLDNRTITDLIAVVVGPVGRVGNSPELSRLSTGAKSSEFFGKRSLVGEYYNHVSLKTPLAGVFIYLAIDTLVKFEIIKHFLGTLFHPGWLVNLKKRV